MATLTHIETDTGTNVNISGITAIGSYTSTGDKLVMVDVSIDQVVGNGNYVMYVTRKIGGAGSAYIILPKTLITAASGETAISAQSGWMTVRNGDVLTVYVDGLDGDTATPDYSTRWFENTDLELLINAIKAKTDLLGASAVSYVTAIEGTTITILRGDTFTVQLPDLGDLTDYVSIDFTVKASKSDTDDKAVIRIRKNASGIGDGLLRLNGAAPTAETGEIIIDDEATGDITITLDETATDDLSTGTYVYDVQLVTATGVQTLTSGSLKVTADVTRAVV